MRELRFLGIAEQSWPVLALLPLIQVAWADGEIQPSERRLIQRVARETYGLDAEGERLLQNWLAHAPSEQYLVKGRECFHLLATHFPELARIDTVLELAEGVARAAGGLFGFRPIDAREQEVLKELIEALSVPPARRWDWSDILDEEEEEPHTAPQLEGVPAAAAQVLLQALDAPRSQDGACLVRTDVEPAVRLDLPQVGATLGRSRACDIWIRSDSRVSRHHARLSCTELAWRLEDNQSTTGTWVNGERVIDRRLFGGESVRIGEVTFRFELSR